MADDFGKQRAAYARWWFAVEAANQEFLATEEAKDAEDLGDYVETMNTLHGFGPNPRTFPEHPWAFDGTHGLMHDPYGETIHRVVEALKAGINNDGRMSEHEHETLKEIREFLVASDPHINIGS